MATISSRGKRKAGWCYIDYIDHDGFHRAVRWEGSRSDAAEAGKVVEQLVSLRRAGGFPDEEMAAWLAKSPLCFLFGLARIGIINQPKSAAEIPLEEHLNDWAAMLTNKTTRPESVKKKCDEVAAVFRHCRFRYWADISHINLVKALKNSAIYAFVDDAGACAGSIVNFCHWMVTEQRAYINPVRKLADIKKWPLPRRRFVTPDEFSSLLAAVTAGDGANVVEPAQTVRPEAVPPWGTMTGSARAALYAVANQTEMPLSHIFSLRIGMVDFDARQIFLRIRIKGEFMEKNYPLTAAAVRVVARYMSDRSRNPQAKLFVFQPKRQQIAEWLKNDLSRAGIPYKDSSGLIIDFLSLAKSGKDWEFDSPSRE